MTPKRKNQIVLEEMAWKEEKEFLQREKALAKDKKRFFSKLPKFSTTKMLIFFLFLNCSLIEIFTGYITIQSILLAYATGISADFTPLVTLIGAVVGEVIGFAIYAIKSTKENTVGGITYLNAEQQYNIQG